MFNKAITTESRPKPTIISHSFRRKEERKYESWTEGNQSVETDKIERFLCVRILSRFYLIFNILYGIVKTGYFCKVGKPFKVERQKLNKEKRERRNIECLIVGKNLSSKKEIYYKIKDLSLRFNAAFKIVFYSV